MRKITNVVLILLAILALTACTTTKSAEKTPVCPKVLLPDLPSQESFPDYKTLTPGRSYTPKHVEVATLRSNISVLELYFKSVQAWIESAKAAVDIHNKSVDESIKKIKEENSKKGWFN